MNVRLHVFGWAAAVGYFVVLLCFCLLDWFDASRQSALIATGETAFVCFLVCSVLFVRELRRDN